jgi:hypothetical protein
MCACCDAKSAPRAALDGKQGCPKIREGVRWDTPESEAASSAPKPKLIKYGVRRIEKLLLACRSMAAYTSIGHLLWLMAGREYHVPDPEVPFYDYQVYS